MKDSNKNLIDTNDYVVTEAEIKQIVDILGLGEYRRILNSSVLMECPFNHNCEQSFMINLKTGIYHCHSCGVYGYIKYLPRALSIHLTPQICTETPIEHLIICEFDNADNGYCLFDILTEDKMFPTIILSRRVDNKNSFCFMYAILDKEITSERLVHLSAILHYHFILKNYFPTAVYNSSSEEVINRYQDFFDTHFHYKVLNYSDKQLNELKKILE